MANAIACHLAALAYLITVGRNYPLCYVLVAIVFTEDIAALMVAFTAMCACVRPGYSACRTENHRLQLIGAIVFCAV